MDELIEKESIGEESIEDSDENEEDRIIRRKQRKFEKY